MSDLEPPQLPESTSDFVKTHCRICAAGQTIMRADPVYPATFCLLLREWVTAGAESKPVILACDRFERREIVPPV